MIRWGLFPFVRPALAAMLGISFYEFVARDWPFAIEVLAVLSVVTGASWATMQSRLPHPHPHQSWAIADVGHYHRALDGAAR